MNPPTDDPATGASAPGEVITFYSYKGGTGRTMALANVACLLARRGAGHSVLMIDWDLEAPGLHHYFAAKLTRAMGSGAKAEKALDAKPGLAEMAAELGRRIAVRAELSRYTQGETPDDAADEADRLVAALDLAPYLIETDIDGVHLVKAGRFDARYAGSLSKLRWEAWYRRSPELFPALARRLRSMYRWVLIDARTGSTDTTGICTMLMPDKLVVVFTPNRQSLVGITDLTRRAVAWRGRYGEARPLLVYPLPSRIDSERESLRQQWREGNPAQNIEGYQPMFEAALKSAHGLKACTLQAYFNEVQVQHSPDYAFGERIAADESQTTTDDRFSVARSYEALLGWLALGIPPWESRERWLGMVELMQLDERIEAFAANNDATARQERSAALRQRIGLVERVHGADSQDALDARHALVLDLAARGQREEALALQQQTVEVFKPAATALGVEALRVLGNLNYGFGLHDAAVAAYRDAHALAITALGAEAIDTLVIGADLGAALRMTGALDEAQQLLEHSVSGLAGVGGDADPRTLAVRGHLAELLWARNRYAEARALQASVLGTQVDALGPTHADTLTSMTVMADMLFRQDEIDAAYALMTQVVAAREQADAESIDTDLARRALANVVARMGRSQEALDLCQRTLEHLRSLLGESHPLTIETMGFAAHFMALQGHTGSARSMQQQALSLARRALGEEHLITLTLSTQLAATLVQLHEFQSAADLQRRALDAFMRLLGESNPTTLNLMMQLAQTCMQQGRLDEARDLVWHAITRCEGAADMPADLLPSLQQAAGQIEMQRGDAESAWAQYRRAIDTLTQHFGLSDTRTGSAMLQAVPALQALGRHEDALQMAQAATQHADADAPGRAAIDETLAIAYSRVGRHADAMALLEQGLGALVARHGEGSNPVVSRYELLATLAKDAGDRDAESRWKDAVIDALKASREKKLTATEPASAQPRFATSVRMS